MEENRNGTLTVVATPIGNLGDITPRAAEALRDADVIAAEDTRRTLRLLNYLEIKNTLISCHRHNEELRTDHILSLLQQGQNVALVSDAGTPGISDPGAVIIKAAADAGIPVTMTPGPAACIEALVLSGLPTERFVFEGFLPMNKKNRRERLAALRDEYRTMIFYEAPHKLTDTLKDLCETFGGDRRVALCRELTKVHEEIDRTTLGEACARFAEQQPLGEFVLVVAGAEPSEEEQDISAETIARDVAARVDSGMRVKDAAKETAKQFGIPARDAYQAYLEFKED